MKKKLISLMLCASMTAALLAGCSSSSSTSSETKAETEAAADAETEAAADAEGGSAAGKTYAIVVKSAGNPYNEKEAEGFKEIIEANGGTCIISEPESATADAQITQIQSLISQNVDSICVAANDAEALGACLQEAMDAGIMVSCLDSSVNPDYRMTFANQAGVQEVAQALVDAVYDITGGEGEWAILSASSQATNQNSWIEAMQAIIEENPDKYGNLVLDEIAYGDDESQKSTDQTQALLSKYPNLKVICAPTTVGIAAAAKVVQDLGSDTTVKVTGLGLPSEMADYIGDDDAHSCPYMFLWNPIDLGKLGAYISMALVDGTITGAEGDTFEAADLDTTYTVVAASDGGTEVILGAPFKFDPENIEEWKTVY